MNKNRFRLTLMIVLCFTSLLVAISVGSVSIPPADIWHILLFRLSKSKLPEWIGTNTVNIFWSIRMPRAIAAFLIGAALSCSGTAMQSILRNPLASTYTLGVTSGASLGASAVMLSGFSILGIFTLPAAGFLSGLLTVLLAMAFAIRLDRSMENQTIILVGMVFSLFVNAILTLVNAMAREQMQQLLFWQMGSLASKSWIQIAVLFPVTVGGILMLSCFVREMDLMTFGEYQAQAIGVNTKRVKLVIVVLASLLTGCAVSFSGVIGFVDLIAPHVVRKIFGPSHCLVLPTSALFGGAFLTLADTIARTVLSPSELPVGAVTALIGAPFFAYIYFQRKRK